MKPASALLLLAALGLAACANTVAPPVATAPPSAPAAPGVPAVAAPPTARAAPAIAGPYSGLCVHPDRDAPGQPAGALRDFLATRPTPDALRARFPDLRIILPGQPTTMEFRRDCRRFFATLDGEGRVTGGRFN